jgi:hypothetical protein
MVSLEITLRYAESGSRSICHTLEIEKHVSTKYDVQWPYAHWSYMVFFARLLFAVKLPTPPISWSTSKNYHPQWRQKMRCIYSLLGLTGTVFQPNYCSLSALMLNLIAQWSRLLHLLPPHRRISPDQSSKCYLDPHTNSAHSVQSRRYSSAFEPALGEILSQCRTKCSLWHRRTGPSTRHHCS